MKTPQQLIAFFVAIVLCQLSVAQNFEQQALDKKLSQSTLWQRLSHYQASGESYIDDPKFFLAKNGKHSAKDELQASIKRLQQEPELQCRYPARAAWLSQKLPGFEQVLPEADCPKYQAWRSKVGDYGVTLVLASSFLNSPSSMYGHTFLRFDDSAEGLGETLGAYAVNFGAEVGQDSEGFMYAVKGLFGGYNGFFSDGPYYEKVKEYSRFDNRDVWEYRLNLRGEEMNRLLMHLWELQNINFDYFFFDENCSYRLLELLEVARPSVTLSEGYGLYTIPVDTIWSVEDAGLVESVVYRPSNQTDLQFNIDKLSPAEQQMAKQLAKDMDYWQSDNIQALSNDRRYQVALVAYQTLRFDNNKTRRQQSIAKHSLNLLLKIKQYSTYGENDKPQEPAQPTEGHRTTALTIAGGSEGGAGFADLGFRLSYHDLLDNVPAYAKGMSLNMGNLVLRAKDSHLQLQQLDLVEITSVNPRSRFFKPLSWQVRTGLERQWTFGDDELVGHFTGGGGLTYKLWGDLNAYGMGLAKLEYNPGFERNLDVALGAEFGLLYQKPFGAFHAKVESFYFAKDYLRRQLNVGYQQRLAINHGLRLQFKRVLNEQDAVNEASMAYRFLLLMKICRLALLAITVLLFSACSNLVFYPSKNWQTTPEQHGYQYQNFYYLADDGTALNAWFMPETTGNKKGLIIYFHGNSQNIGSHVGQVYWLTDQGYDVFLMDYRGFGKSKGDVDLEKSFDDIAATLRYAYKNYPEKNTYVLAQSLGASMAGFVLGNNKTLRQPLTGIVLDAGFTNYKAITKDVMSRHWLTWSFQYPASWTMPKAYGLDGVIANISPTPLLIIHGTKDAVVPFRFGEQLFAKAQKPKAFLRYDGGHIAAFYDPGNRQLLLDWLAQPTAEKPKKN